MICKKCDMLCCFQIHIPTKPLHAQCTECGHQQEVIWETISEYGRLMTMEHFINCVNLGGFNDSDGYGNLASKDKMSCLEVTPSLLIKDPIYKHHDVTSIYTHIAWFNR